MVLSPRRGWEVVPAGPHGVTLISNFCLCLVSFFVCRTGALLTAEVATHQRITVPEPAIIR